MAAAASHIPANAAATSTTYSAYEQQKGATLHAPSTFYISIGPANVNV